jgi:hypothetical protein
MDNMGEVAVMGAGKRAGNCAGKFARMGVYANDPKLGAIILEGLLPEFRPSRDAGDSTRTMRLEWSTILPCLVRRGTNQTDELLAVYVSF